MVKVTMTEFQRKTRQVLDLVDREGRVSLTYRGKEIGIIMPSPTPQPKGRGKRSRCRRPHE